MPYFWYPFVKFHAGPISLVGVLELRFDLLHLLFLGQHRLGRFDLCEAGPLHHAAVDVHQRQAEP